MKSSSIIIIVVAILVILGGWYAYATYYMPAAAPSTNTTINTNPNGADYSPGNANTDTTASSSAGVGLGADVNAGVTTSSAPSSATITLTAGGFSPKSVTIKKGGTITWKNTSSGGMWVASDNHPTHTVYDGTSLQQHCAAGATPSLDECKNGSTYSFTFTKIGSWDFHNHLNASQEGTVIVVQ